MIKNRHGWPVEISTIQRTEFSDSGVSITKDDGWSLFVSADELDGFVPEVGDWILTESPVNQLATIIIEGRVIRRRSPREIDAEHEAFCNKFRLDKLEEYIEHGDELKERVKKLHPVLQARMSRFAEEDGVEFWIDSAPYEMACLEGAQALLNKVAELDLYDGGNTGYEAAIQWIEDWWKLDYKEQMTQVPDFGEGHSGNTAAVAKHIARIILQGDGDKL